MRTRNSPCFKQRVNYIWYFINLIIQDRSLWNFQYFLDKYYHQRKILKYLNNLQKNNLIENFDQIFDVGSHKGEYIKLFLKLNRHAKIQAFEPIKKIYNELVDEFKDNKNRSKFSKGFEENR